MKQKKVRLTISLLMVSRKLFLTKFSVTRNLILPFLMQKRKRLPKETCIASPEDAYLF